MERFEARWPIGTRERLAIAVLLYTGLRRGDAAMLGRQHVRGGSIVLRTAKTGTVVEIPILPPLAEVMAATKFSIAANKYSQPGFAFICTASGAPMTKESFGNWFKGACRAASVPGTAHGLRKAGATRAAEIGATEAELDAIFGWRGGRMASIYTRAANRAKLARGAIWKMEKAK
ncbi:MAG: tyrosine-type recombinase/integrase [Methylocella sp.]